MRSPVSCPLFALLFACALAVLLLAGCSREEPKVLTHEVSAPVKEAMDLIEKFEGCGGPFVSRRLDVRGLTLLQFRRQLMEFPAKEVHVWMPGEKDWLLVGRPGTNGVSLAQAMDVFAADTNCTVTVSEVFASYVGTKADVVPAFAGYLEGEVVPEWFVTKEIPALGWLDESGVDEDILKMTRQEIRSAQTIRRELLRGNMLAAKARDKKGEEEATEVWARVALRNPKDPMLLERIENLNRNAVGFIGVGKLIQALKCYETLVLIRPNDASAVHNFGLCLMKIGKRDMAEKVLKRAQDLLREQERSLNED